MFQMQPYIFVLVQILIIFVSVFAQRDSGGKVNILETDSIGHCKKKSLYKHLPNSKWLPSYSCCNLARSVP